MSSHTLPPSFVPVPQRKRTELMALNLMLPSKMSNITAKC